MPGLIRLIILGLLLGFVFTLLRKFQRNRLIYKNKSSSTQKATRQSSSKKTVQCELCGIYVPADEAVHDGDHVFCSEEHKQANKK